MKDSLKNLDAEIDKVLELFHVPGAAVGIVIDHQILLARGYGFRSLAQQLPVTEQTLFPIGSCTKAFTTLVLAQLVDEGKISWDDLVTTHIPELHFFNPDLTSQVTIRDLIAHRTGIPRHDALWIFSDISKTDVIYFQQYFQPAYLLRENFLYNNFMYSLAGIVIERVTGKNWEEEIAERIFRPLGMNDSNTDLEQLQSESDFSLPYAEINRIITEIPFRKLSPVKPGGAINSNVWDMLKWAQLQLSNGQIFNRNLIRAETLQEMHKVQIPFAASPIGTFGIHSLGYGLGWFIGNYNGYSLIHHGGCIDGFFSDVVLIPQYKIGIVILTNSSSNGSYVVDAIRNKILDQLIGIKDQDWIKVIQENDQGTKHALEKLEKEKTETHPARSLQSYIGKYQHPAYGVAHVYLENNQLKVTYQNRLIPLIHKCEDIFEGKFLDLSHYGIYPFVDFSFFNQSCEADEIDELHISFESFRGAKAIVFKRMPI